ncbi:hypothetical protein cypCar_00043562 [Cyprinus carpio]|nr:hypothetical protein cypCar_00043562 [Cyprinus carpio]
MAVDWFGYGYAALITIGGIVGYVKAGSVMSLVAGLMFGIAAFVGAHQMSKHDKDIWVSLGTCGSLTALMGVRFLSSWKIMPAGLMAGARQGYFIFPFVDVPEDWCESATEFTKEETMTSLRNSTCRSCGDALTQID